MYAGANSATFTITNNCLFTIWPATLRGGRSSTSTGFELPPKLPQLSISNFHGKVDSGQDLNVQQTTGKFICATGDRGSGQIPCNGVCWWHPSSFISGITLASNSGQDFYDVSLIDGFNLPVSVTSHGGSGDSKTSSCPNDVNRICPPNFAVDGSDGNAIACKSACFALNQPEYCCPGSFASPDKCPLNVYSVIFKNQCPLAYSYAYDDKTSTFTCFGGAKYSITFCPSNNVR